MSLYTVTTGNTILAGDLNQLVNVLQRASSQTETGKYFLSFNAYANNAVGALYMPTLSRNTTPVSVSIDTADQSASGCGSPSTNSLTANGFKVYAFSTGATLGANVGGNWTVQY